LGNEPQPEIKLFSFAIFPHVTPPPVG
jgi:hypothetical protein